MSWALGTKFNAKLNANHSTPAASKCSSSEGREQRSWSSPGGARNTEAWTQVKGSAAISAEGETDLREQATGHSSTPFVSNAFDEPWKASQQYRRLESIMTGSTRRPLRIFGL